MKKQYKQIPLGTAKDISGQRFGNLTALYRTESNGKKQTYWVCKCDCGVIKSFGAGNLRSGGTTSCGCQNREKAKQRMLEYNLSQISIFPGDRFGKLTVLEHAGLKKQTSRDKRESWYLCQCDCGSEPKEIRGNDLQSGAIVSCGCISSYGEEIVRQILDKKDISYKKEYTFENLRNPKTNHFLRFDFAIFENNQLLYLIEFDGRQHFFGPEGGWTHSSSLEDIQYKDNLKNEYCKTNNIILKRIPYTSLSHLSYEEIISDKYNI